jgi:transcriptional regulator with GAF, ATPase, and Fis domain
MVFYPEHLIGRSKAFNDIQTFIEEAASTDYPVLLLGETGVGKEVAARLIHKKSKRKGRAFVPINITTFPETLLESELFGHKKGAFTNARQDRAGLLEEAEGGTLFLDEIADCLLSLQVKLLRVIDTRERKKLGEDHIRKVDVRFIFATNKKIEREISSGRFRKDFYYRISVHKLLIPPLRERKEDIPLLFGHIMETMSEGKKKKMSEKALNKLLSYSFPGNIRELENIIIRAICRARGQEIREEDIVLEAIEEEPKITKAEKLYWDMRQGGGTFWEVVYKPFLERDLDRNTVKQIIVMGLKESGGSYKKILPLFNMSSDEKLYKRFMKFLRVHRLQH